MEKFRKFRLVVLAAIVIIVMPLTADEGMWLLNNLPAKLLKEKYNFVPTVNWAEEIQLSAVRLPSCSASFVSPSGLVMTNWHCAEETVQKLSTAQNDLYKNGFYARTGKEELKTDLTLMQLVSMEDITTQLEAAAKNDKNSDPSAARGGALRVLIAQKTKDTGLKCEAVSLYQGGQFYLYGYKVYDDVRLVFIPDKSAGFFGGDADNFEYPRYNLDVSFLRAYEKGKPASTPHYFKWSKGGAAEGELVFAAGHPGSTQRLLTSDALKTLRDVKAPFILDLMRRQEITIQQFALRGAEEKRITASDLFSVENTRKLYLGKLKGLQDPVLINEKKKFEAELLKTSDQNLRRQIAEGLKLVREAQKEIARLYPLVIMVARGFAFDSVLFGPAASMPSLLNLKYEEAKLANSLSYLAELLGADHPFVVKVLNGLGPAQAAHRLAAGYKANAPNNPVIEARQAISAEANDLQTQYARAAEKERQGYAELSDALFKIFGTDVYPDATFTLRLAFGTVEGYDEYGQIIKPWTDFHGLFRRSDLYGHQEPWKLNSRWYWAKYLWQLDLDVPLNFVSTLDITGGNSGSPVFNRNREIVGLIFDSNIYGLASDFDYDYDKLNRAVAVHSAGILEALEAVYRAGNLAKEIRGK